MYQVQTYKKASWSTALQPTGSPKLIVKEKAEYTAWLWLWQGNIFPCFAMEQEVFYNSTLHDPISPKFLKFDKSLVLNTSTCKHPVIGMAPPICNKK